MFAKFVIRYTFWISVCSYL